MAKGEGKGLDPRAWIPGDHCLALLDCIEAVLDSEVALFVGRASFVHMAEEAMQWLVNSGFVADCPSVCLRRIRQLA